jgi:hypothetical protein
MLIRNPILLKRPWIVVASTIYLVIVGVFAALYTGANGADAVVIIGIAVLVGAAMNVWFFSSLKKTRKIIQTNGAAPPMAARNAKTLSTLLLVLGVLLPVVQFRSYLSGPRDRLSFSDATGSLWTCVICIYLGIRLRKPKPTGEHEIRK